MIVSLTPEQIPTLCALLDQELYFGGLRLQETFTTDDALRDELLYRDGLKAIRGQLQSPQPQVGM